MNGLRRRAAGWRRARGVRLIALVLAAFLAIGGGYLIGFVATRPPASPTPTPPLIAGSPFETPQPTATPTPTPTRRPATSTPAPTPTPAPTTPRPTLPPATPRPTLNISPQSGEVAFRLTDVGLDERGSSDHRPRTISFATDHSGTIVADVAGTTGGSIELCVTPAAPGDPPNPAYGDADFCRELRDGSMRQTVRSGRQQWTVTLAATEDGRAPVTDFAVRFPSATAAIHLSDFRFAGTDDDARNGFTAEIATRRRGSLRVAASWTDTDGDSTHDWGLSVFDVTEGSRPVYRSAGTGSGVERSTLLRPGRRFEVRLENREAGNQPSVALKADLSWP